MPVRFHVVNAWQKKFPMDEFSLTCDAGLESGRCLWKGVVYCMSCAECGELYARETERPVRKRFAEHFRGAKNMTVRTLWGGGHIIAINITMHFLSPHFSRS